MTVTAEARTTLAAALRTALAARPGWSVFDTRPPEPTAPFVFLDAAGRRAGDEEGAPIVVVTFPVVAIVDGSDAAQVSALDDVGDLIWDTAVILGGDPGQATPDTVDVGGPTLYRLTTVVDVIVQHRTLCDLTEADNAA